MSSQPREPMWFCHECNSEMRPLMMPDPHCASCRGTFVEKMENPEDDPREFHNTELRPGDDFGPLGLLASFNEMLRESATPPSGRRSVSPLRNTGGLQIAFGSPNTRRTFVIGGPNVLNRRESETNPRPRGLAGSSPPRLSDFLRANNEASGASEPRDMNIPGQLMAQYMMALLGGVTLGGPRGASPFLSAIGPDGEHGPGNGRLGDYVFTQEALDQLMTQLMEGGSSTRPVAAPEETVEKLPREVLEEGSPLLERDCAVCKEQFNAHAEEADEQVAVTLPCKHPFHEGCIVPWLKSSGTCPVCRFALVPQPSGHAPEPAPLTEARPSSSERSTSPSPGTFPGGPTVRSSSPPPNRPSTSSNNNNNPTNTNTSSGGGFFSSLFGHRRNGSSNNARTSHSTSPARDRQQRRPSGDNNSHIPGGWGDSLD